MDTLEKIARIVYEVNPARQPWDGDCYTYGEAKRLNDHRIRLAHKQAKKLIESGLVAEA